MKPRSVIVPQATLAKVRAIVDALPGGADSSTSISRATGFSARHVGYALDAAIVLGLVERSATGFTITERGRALAATAKDSEAERQALLDAMRASSTLTTIAPDLLHGKEPTRDEVAAQVARAGGLAPATAAHRAAMLLGWRRAALNPQARLAWKKSHGMWRRIEIRNFRSIEAADVVLAPFSILVGPNGSGKSNFADTLVFARDVALDATAALSSRGGIVGVRRWRPSKPNDVSIDVRAASSRAALGKSYVRHQFKIHSGKAGDWQFSQEEIEVVDDGETKAHVERKNQKVAGTPRLGTSPAPTASLMALAKQLKPFAKTSSLRNVRRYRLNPDEMRQPQLAGEDTRLSETGANIAAAVRSIPADQVDAILKPMRKIVPGLEHVYVEQVGRYSVLKFRQRQAGGAPADFNATEMSEGALRALGIIVATHQMEADELLIVEEPEVSIHAGAAGLLFEVLKAASERGAVLVTTHSADLLDRARDEEILVCAYDDGVTRIGPLARAQREIVRDGLFSLAELMRSEPLRIEGEGEAPPVSEPPRRRARR